MTILRATLGLSFLLVASVAVAQFSTFETGAEGWTVVGTPGNYTLPPQGFTPVSVVAGPTGQCIYTEDVYGETFFAAPASFLGNRSSRFGENFEFDTYVSFTDSVNYPTLILMGAGNVGLWHVAPFPPVGAWLHKSIPLVGSSFRSGSWTGPVATDAEVQAVLANLTGIFVQAEWRTGPDATFLDNVGFTGSLNSVSGTVTLNDTVLPMAGHTVRVDIRNGSTVVDSIPNVVLGAGGAFQVATSATGTYTVSVRGTHWVSRSSVPVLIGASGVTGLTYVLPNGDSDNSGEVDAADIDLIIAGFGGTTGDPGFVPNADLDESGEVDAADIDVAIANFGAVDE